jgi:hypothetical protein
MARRFTLITALLLLVIAVGFQLTVRWREVTQGPARTRLGESVTKTLPGWTITEEPLGLTEASSAAALKTLNLDDYVYRRYRRGAFSFTVYAAHWAAGRMPTRLVASHTPDRCWTENGMRCIDMRFRQQFRVQEKLLLPAEARTFTSARDHEKIFVAYWHTVEGRIYDYGARFNAVPHPWLWWKDTFDQAANGSREQLFVRIASPLALEVLWRDEDFQTVMASVAALGLYTTDLSR